MNSRPNISPQKRSGINRGNYYGIANAMHQSKRDSTAWLIALAAVVCFGLGMIIGITSERNNAQTAANIKIARGER